MGGCEAGVGQITSAGFIQNAPIQQLKIATYHLHEIGEFMRETGKIPGLATWIG